MSFTSSENTSQQGATILLAHGSTDQNWLAPFADLLANIRAGLDTERVELAYMELAEPSLEHQITQLAKEGYKHIDVLPLFFAAGRHLRRDVPNIIESLQADLSAQGHEISVELHAPVGLDPEVAAAISRIVIQKVSQKA